MKHGKIGKERFEAQPPPIPLVSEEVPEDKEKGHYLKLDLKTSPGLRTSETYQAQVKIFKSGTPEELLRFSRNMTRWSRDKDSPLQLHRLHSFAASLMAKHQESANEVGHGQANQDD